MAPKRSATLCSGRPSRGRHDCPDPRPHRRRRRTGPFRTDDDAVRRPADQGRRRGQRRPRRPARARPAPPRRRPDGYQDAAARRIAATRLLSAQPHPPAVLVLTTFDADELVLRALQAGAAGFLLKDSPPADIVRAIDSVHAGEGTLSPRITRRLITLAAGDPAAAPRREQARQRLAALTPREREVAAAVAGGSSNAEIAARLHMSLATVKAHVSRLLVKLDAANRVQIALLVQDAAAGRPRLSMTPDQPRRNGRSARLLANRQITPRPSVDDAWLMSALARSALR